MGHDHLIPNTTQVPNLILDYLLPFLWEGEAKVLLYLCRRIYGFHKEADSVSLPQFVQGIRHAGRQVDFGTGLSRQAVINALNSLKAMGIVEQLSGGPGRGRVPCFRINHKCEMVQWLDLIAQEPESAKEKIVQRLDLFRKKGTVARPLTRKPAPEAASEKKVHSGDLLQKGLTVRPTKERKKRNPPEYANAYSDPHGGSDAVTASPWMQTWTPSKRFPQDFPSSPPPWFLQWAKTAVPLVDIAHQWPYMRDHTYRSPKTQFFMCARKWMEIEQRQAQPRASPMSASERKTANNLAVHDAFIRGEVQYERR